MYRRRARVFGYLRHFGRVLKEALVKRLLAGASFASSAAASRSQNVGFVLRRAVEVKIMR